MNSYSILLPSFPPPNPRLGGELIEAIQPKVSDRMNASLIRDFQAMEVEKALKQTHPTQCC